METLFEIINASVKSYAVMGVSIVLIALNVAIFRYAKAVYNSNFKQD